MSSIRWSTFMWSLVLKPLEEYTNLHVKLYEFFHVLKFSFDIWKFTSKKYLFHDTILCMKQAVTCRFKPKQSSKLGISDFLTKNHSEWHSRIFYIYLSINFGLDRWQFCISYPFITFWLECVATTLKSHVKRSSGYAF